MQLQTCTKNLTNLTNSRTVR